MGEINEKEKRNKMLFKQIARTRFVMNFSSAQTHTPTMLNQKEACEVKLI
jgi:hypothetical protein